MSLSTEAGGIASLASPHRLERPGPLVPAVVAAFLSRIVTGEFSPGTMLPKESDLLLQFGVSRTVIREALRVIEEKGLISIQQGRGTVVNEVDKWNLLDPLIIETQVRNDGSLDVLGQLADMRAAVEAELTRLAAERMSEADLSALADALARLTEALDDHLLYLQIDQEFHDIILRASGNAYGRQVVRNVHGWARHNPLYAEATDEQIRNSHAGHVAVYEKLALREGRDAGEVMRSHILDSWEQAKAVLDAHRPRSEA